MEDTREGPWGECSQTRIGIDLQNAREKTATGNLTNTHDVQHMNEGRHDGMPTMFCVARELTLMLSAPHRPSVAKAPFGSPPMQVP